MGVSDGADGGTGVSVGAAGVFVDGTGVLVGGPGVSVGPESGVLLGPAGVEVGNGGGSSSVAPEPPALVVTGVDVDEGVAVGVITVSAVELPADSG